MVLLAKEKKRSRQDEAQKTRKRQRVDVIRGRVNPPVAKNKSVSLDALPWTEVLLPDRFDDAEGFFGLEEIEDVEVVRDKILGRLEYRVGKVSNYRRSFCFI